MLARHSGAVCAGLSLNRGPVPALAFSGSASVLRAHSSHMDHSRWPRSTAAQQERDSVELLPHGHCYVRSRTPDGHGEVSLGRPV